MKTNLEIENNTAVLYKAHYIDLHNNFDFTSCSEVGSHMRIMFSCNHGKWISQKEFEKLTFILKNINYKYFEDGEIGDYPDEAKVLSDVTFFPSDLREINSSIIPDRRAPNEGDDIIFSFEDGRVIRVNCEEVELIVEE